MLVTRMPDGKPEIFFSIQGEGRTTGRSCIFIRLSVCNLHCKYCDSHFSWNFKELKGENHHYREKISREDNQIEMSNQAMIDAIRQLPSKNIVFTGGEPMIYQQDLVKVMKALRKKDKEYYFEIETNGTIEATKEFLELINQINCSPKMKNSGNPSIIANKPNAIKSIKDLDKTIFKFVICPKTGDSDIEEIKDWQEFYKISSNKIYLMPEGITRKKIIEGSKYIIENFCNRGYHLSTRLHILLFNNKRAV